METGKIPRHVVVSLNTGWGKDGPSEVVIVPREGERLDQWDVSETENTTMVSVWATFVDLKGNSTRQTNQYFNSFRIDRVHIEGED